MRKTFLLSAVLLFPGLIAAAPQADAKGYYYTGSAVRVRKLGPFAVKVYWIGHKMKALPARSARAVIDADVDKMITMKMLRTVDGAKLKSAVVDAFRLNGYSNMGNINTLLSVVSGEAKEGSYIYIWYTASSKTTALNYGGRVARVAGVDFMKALWSCWFGKIDQASVPGGLISQIP